MKPQIAPRVIAHRGACHAFPENTLPAFDAALAEAADGIELDVQMTRDGVIVIHHDDWLIKLGAPQRRMRDLAWDEARKLDAGGWFGDTHRGTKTPRLAEVLERYASTELLIEIKTDDGNSGLDSHNALLVDRTLEEIRAARLHDTISILSFNVDALQRARTAAPTLRYVLNAETPAQALAMKGLEWLHAIDVDVLQLDRASGARLRDRVPRLMSYTCNTPAELRCAIEAGVCAVITDRPAETRRLLQGMQAAQQ